jgi:hypothetical protein
MDSPVYTAHAIARTTTPIGWELIAVKLKTTLELIINKKIY